MDPSSGCAYACRCAPACRLAHVLTQRVSQAVLKYYEGLLEAHRAAVRKAGAAAARAPDAVRLVEGGRGTEAWW
jgi:hypothetical protein